MDSAVFRDALILTGPTASAKTAVGLVLAERLNAEIVSMDSMALYRGMDIGTAKPTPAERRRVPHHLIDVIAPTESASVAWWLRAAADTVEEINQRGRRALIVGGTPLYLKALLRGIFEGPSADAELRRRLEEHASAALHGRLQAVDPPTAARLHLNDRRRIIRALEVHETTGRPISEWQQEFKRIAPRPSAPLWLDWPREVLYARIDRRVDQMMAGGLLDEVRRLAESPMPLSRTPRQALGYKELLDHLAGKEALEEAIVRTKTRSRNFAKRQLTWFRHLEECRCIAAVESESPEKLSDRVISSWGILQ